jgi:ParB family chromosome partitioning protein
MAERKIIKLRLDQIVCEDQVRKDFEDQEDLMGLGQTLREAGQLVPLLVRPQDSKEVKNGKFVVVDGERRYRAAKMAGLTELDAIIDESKPSPQDIALQQLLINWQRKDLNPVEKAVGISLVMKENGWSATQVAAATGTSNSMISRLLSVTTLPPEIQEKVRKGELPVSAAFELAKVDDAAEQAKLAGQVASGELTRDALSGQVKGKKRPPSASTPTAPSRVTAKLGEGRSVTVCAGGLSLETFISVLEEMLQRARAARPKGLSLDTFLKVLLDQSKATK